MHVYHWMHLLDINIALAPQIPSGSLVVVSGMTLDHNCSFATKTNQSQTPAQNKSPIQDFSDAMDASCNLFAPFEFRVQN